MREIKFRAWHKVGPFMFQVTYLNLENGRAGEMSNLTSIWDFRIVELMQFTGLKDRNGKEIYEGDIVQFKNRYMDKAEVLGFVKFDEARGSFTFTDLKDVNKKNPEIFGATFVDSFDNGVHTAENLEIIGNIYENQDLLQ